MNIELAVDLLRELVSQSLLLVMPILMTSIVVGVSVSLLQSITSIQEATLTFVPKLAAVAAVFLVSAHWMVRSLVEFAYRMISLIPEIAK